MSWRKSTHSTTNGCVEVNMEWRKSSHSNTNGCLEVAFVPEGWIGVRDSKDPDGPVLTFNPVEWQAFLAGVRGGQFDLQ